MHRKLYALYAHMVQGAGKNGYYTITTIIDK